MSLVASYIFVMQGEVKDEDFRNYFEQFGEIEDCVVSHVCQAFSQDLSWHMLLW